MSVPVTSMLILALMLINLMPGFANTLMSNVFTYIGQPGNKRSIILGGYRRYNWIKGVFLKQDSFSPLNGTMTFNGYSYSLGNPVMRIDPSGHVVVRFLSQPSQWLPGRSQTHLNFYDQMGYAPSSIPIEDKDDVSLTESLTDRLSISAPSSLSEIEEFPLILSEKDHTELTDLLDGNHPAQQINLAANQYTTQVNKNISVLDANSVLEGSVDFEDSSFVAPYRYASIKEAVQSQLLPIVSDGAALLKKRVLAMQRISRIFEQQPTGITAYAHILGYADGLKMVSTGNDAHMWIMSHRYQPNSPNNLYQQYLDAKNEGFSDLRDMMVASI